MSKGKLDAKDNKNGKQDTKPTEVKMAYKDSEKGAAKKKEAPESNT